MPSSWINKTCDLVSCGKIVGEEILSHVCLDQEPGKNYNWRHFCIREGESHKKLALSASTFTPIGSIGKQTLANIIFCDLTY